MKNNARYFYFPETASVAIADQGVTLEQLNDIICNLSFDRPGAKVNYRIEVCADGEGLPEKKCDAKLVL